MRRDLRDDFAIRLEHEPEHAMGAGVLRPHIDKHLVGADVELDDGLIRKRGGGHMAVILHVGRQRRHLLVNQENRNSTRTDWTICQFCLSKLAVTE